MKTTTTATETTETAAAAAYATLEPRERLEVASYANLEEAYDAGRMWAPSVSRAAVAAGVAANAVYEALRRLVEETRAADAKAAAAANAEAARREAAADEAAAAANAEAARREAAADEARREADSAADAVAAEYAGRVAGNLGAYGLSQGLTRALQDAGVPGSAQRRLAERLGLRRRPVARDGGSGYGFHSHDA